MSSELHRYVKRVEKHRKTCESMRAWFIQELV